MKINVPLLILAIIVDLLFLFRMVMNYKMLTSRPLEDIIPYICRKMPTKELLFFAVGALNPLAFGVGVLPSTAIGLASYLLLHEIYSFMVQKGLSRVNVSVLSANKIRVIFTDESGVGIGTINKSRNDSNQVKINVRSLSGSHYSDSDVKVLGIDRDVLIIE